jgi:hypothetical protein
MTSLRGNFMFKLKEGEALLRQAHSTVFIKVNRMYLPTLKISHPALKQISSAVMVIKLARETM